MEREVLPAGTKLHLPIWLGIALARREIAEIKNPRYMSKQYYNTLNADSDVVTLR